MEFPRRQRMKRFITPPLSHRILSYLDTPVDVGGADSRLQDGRVALAWKRHWKRHHSFLNFCDSLICFLGMETKSCPTFSSYNHHHTPASGHISADTSPLPPAMCATWYRCILRWHHSGSHLQHTQLRSKLFWL